MDKSFMVFIIIGIGFLYFVTTFVGDIQAKDDRYQNDEYTQEHLYSKYKTIDSVGQNILDLTNASESMQIQVWNNTELKEEFLDLFPDFSEMKLFVSDRITGGESLHKKLNRKIEKIESQFFAGEITMEQAKHELGSLN